MALLTHVAVAGPRIHAPTPPEWRARRPPPHRVRPPTCRSSGTTAATVLNAGSIGPRRFALPIVFGVLEIADGKLSLRHVDCETGEDWHPQ
ncbi:MAG: hypothetical protein R3B82_02295 [Sandaracinaceae bacterium]